jgi:hypothetical protein
MWKISAGTWSRAWNIRHRSENKGGRITAMKRIVLQRPAMFAEGRVASARDDPALRGINDYVAELRLLEGVPFSYLIPDENLLPPESIRFFHLDENWLNALTDGALSIGRVSPREAATDDRYLGAIARESTRLLAHPRFRKMHENHRRSERAADVASKARTGVVLRSELVGKWKGLEAFGYHGETLLEILRMEALSSEILLCLFDGELTKFVISEPPTGLRFGSPDSSGTIALRDVSDTEALGKPLGSSLDLTEFTEPNGRLKISELADRMRETIEKPISSPQFAFELIAVAQRAEFIRGDK